jgi:hypothetical protein
MRDRAKAFHEEMQLAQRLARRIADLCEGHDPYLVLSVMLSIAGATLSDIYATDAAFERGLDVIERSLRMGRQALNEPKMTKQ